MRWQGSYGSSADAIVQGKLGGGGARQIGARVKAKGKEGENEQFMKVLSPLTFQVMSRIVLYRPSEREGERKR